MNSMTRDHDHQHQRRIHQQALGLRREFVLPFERRCRGSRIPRSAARSARRRGPGSRTRCRTPTGAAPCAATARLPPSMSSISAVSTSRKRGLSIESRRSRMPSMQRNAGARDLLHVEAERDQVPARDACRRVPKPPPAGLDLAERDEIETHAAQPQLEVHLVHRIESAARGAPVLSTALY